jgi:hypothetical protein
MEKEHLDYDYYRDTSSEEFLADLRAILADGDYTIPLRLIRNIHYMTGKYIDARRSLDHISECLCQNGGE